MASLKQTQIYGALRIYNTVDENTTFENTISIDPEENNGKLTFSDDVYFAKTININDLKLSYAASVLNINKNVSLAGYTLTSKYLNTESINGLTTLSFNNTTTGSNSITNIHSIAFDSTDYSNISNLYSLSMKNSGNISFTDGDVTITSSDISTPYLYSGNEDDGTFIEIGGGEITTPKIRTAGDGSTTINGGTISQGDLLGHSSIAKDKIQVAEGINDIRRSTLTGTKIENVYTNVSGAAPETSTVTITEGKISFTNPSNKTATLSWDGAYLSSNQPIKVGKIKTNSTNILISGTNDINTSATYGVAIGDNITTFNGVGGVAIGAKAAASAGAISIGRRSSATGENSIAIGSKNNSSANICYYCEWNRFYCNRCSDSY